MEPVVIECGDNLEYIFQRLGGVRHRQATKRYHNTGKGHEK